MFEAVFPGKVEEIIHLFGRGKMLPSLDMKKDEAITNQRSLSFIEFLVCICHIAKRVLPTTLKKHHKSHKLEELVSRLLQNLALALEFAMEYPPEPDYDLN